MQNYVNNRQLRSFGLILGTIFALIGLWPLFVYGMELRIWSILLAALFLIATAIYPRALFYVYKGWMAAGHVMGWVNTRIILGFVFFAVVTPVGYVRRLLGKDPMGRNLEPHITSYRIPRRPRPASHLKRQY